MARPNLWGRKTYQLCPPAVAEPLEFSILRLGMRFAPLFLQKSMPWRNPELVTGVERCLNEVSDALQRLARECDVLREDALGGRAVEPSG